MPNSEQDAQFEILKKKFTIEFAVGLFALIGVACFAYLAVNIAGVKLSQAGYYDIQAEFDNVAGLKVGAPVEIAGVEVGVVSKISLNETSAIVKMRVKDGVSVRDDDIAAIRTKGIIGDRYVKMIPGGSDIILGKGEELLQTESAVELEEVLGKFMHKVE